MLADLADLFLLTLQITELCADHLLPDVAAASVGEQSVDLGDAQPGPLPQPDRLDTINRPGRVAPLSGKPWRGGQNPLSFLEP